MQKAHSSRRLIFFAHLAFQQICANILNATSGSYYVGSVPKYCIEKNVEYIFVISIKFLVYFFLKDYEFFYF